MSTTHTPPTTRTPIARNSGHNYVLNVPVEAHREYGITAKDGVHIVLRQNGNRVKWYLDRSMQPYNRSLYFSVPAELVQRFSISSSDDIPVRVTEAGIEYELNDHHSLVIKPPR